MSNNQPAPVRPDARIEVIDVLRGFAILGVLIMNMGAYTGSYETIESWSALARRVNWINHFLFEAKFYSMLSVLFGLGMAMQMLRAEARGLKFIPTYVRRLLVLMLFGLVHATFLWTGDILFTYALCGFLLLLFRKLPPRWILVAAGVVLLHPLIISLPAVAPAFGETFGKATEGLQQMVRSSEHLYLTGNYFQVTVHRFWEAFMYRLVIFFAFGNVFAMFLVGLYLGRRKIFQNIPQKLPWFRRVMWVSLILGLLLNGLYVFFIIFPDQVPDDLRALSRRGIRTIGAPTLCFFYMTAIILLYQKAWWRRWLSMLAPVGRMALTNYLMHSLVLTTIFYGYGLGIYGNFTPTADLILAIFFYAFQIWISAWWLERYRFGPAEWLWRSLSYGRLQPLRVDVEAAQATPSRRSVALVAGSILLLGFIIMWRGWNELSQEEQSAITGGLPAVGPTPTLVLPTPQPTPTPTPVATPVVEPVTRPAGPAAKRGDLWELALAFDEELALAEIETLTGPPYLGRLAGSPGGHAAGDYIAQRFAAYGLRPVGGDGTYFQPFPLTYSRLTAMPQLSVTDPAGIDHTYWARRDFAPMVTRFMGGGQAAGPAIWANECSHADFDYTDVVNKVVLCWDRLLRQRREDVGRNALEHGAAGLLLLSDPDEARPFDRLAPNRESWVPDPIPTLRISETVAHDLLAGTDLTLADMTTALLPFPLSTTVRLEVPLQIDESAQGRNVLGVLPGRDPAHKEEVVILGAHYDHVGEDPDGRAWPGANDNASGVAALLETARSWQAQGYVPRRTVLFAAWDAEEMGLDGSRHYVEYPRYPLTGTVAMLQLDMIGAGEDTLYLDRRGELTPKLNTAARALGLSTEITNLGGSDHVPFMEAHIPAGLLIWFGPEETEATAHYHRPMDTAAIIEPDKLAAAGRLANLATLALAEGEPAILTLLKTRFEAANRGDLETFLETGTPARRPIDRAWFGALQSLRSPELELEATRLRVAGDVATATVKVALEHAPNWPLKSSETVWLPVRFTYQEDGWRWDGPALVWPDSPDGFPVDHPPGYRAEALEISHLAARQYARIAGQLGLPVESRGRLMIYPDQQALRGDSNPTLPPDVEALVDPGGDYPPLVKLVYTPHLSQTRQVTDTLVQLALAEAGLTESSLPWLWQGLPLVYRTHATPVTARTNHLPGLYEALISNAGGGHASPLASDSLAWAAVEFLREQVGWAGLGQLAIALGRGSSPDQALTQVVGLDEAEFESRWRTVWQERLQQAQAGLAALLAARQQAVLGNDSAAFLQAVDPADPILLAEESYWFNQLALHPVEQFELAGQPLAFLENGDLLAEIKMNYKLAGDKNRRVVPLTVRLRATGSGYRWAGALFETRNSEHFVIHYPAGYERVVRDLLNQAEPVYRQVTADLQIEPNGPIPIKLYAQPDPFRASIALATPDWLEGWAAAGQSVKLLVAPQTTPAGFGRSLARQLSRALLARPDRQFSWLPEGLALVEAGRLSRADERSIYDHYLPLLAKSIRIGRLFPLADPPGLYGLPEKEAELAYAQSWDQVTYLIDRYGQAKLASLFGQFHRGQTIDAAFQQVYDLPLAEFESPWHEAAVKGHVRSEWLDLAQTFDVAAAEAHIAELTRPELAGRQAGTAGEALAAAYIADKFASYGLTPAGDDRTFFQRFPITTPVLLASPRLWLLAENGEPQAALRYRQEFGLIQARGAGGGQVEAEVVWLRGEDYGSIRLAGKIVLRELAGPVEDEIEQAVAHGAGGLILVSTRLDKELRAKDFPVDELEAIVEASAGGIPVVELTQAGFKRLLATAGYSPADLKTGPPVMPLDLRLLLAAPLEWQALESANVVGLLPGSDPVLKDEILILAAAYDHVGDDPDDRVCLVTGECLDLSGYKYPGTNDDASAVAVLLELARLWHQSGYRPARSVLFVAWGGQELADAGSRHYLAHPSAPLADVVGVVQLEAVGGGRGFRLQAQGDWQREAVLRFATETAANQVERRLAWAEADQPASRESFRNLGIPGLLLRWEKAEPHNLPAEFDDELDPLRLGQTGRTVTLASIMLAH